jgi:hypothetical protein
MKTIISFITAFVLILIFAGCEQYENYIKDYDYSTVYFGAQKPLRTLVARTNNDYLEFKIGVTLAGLRENNKGYTARFELDPELLNIVEGANQFTLLPAECYTIVNPDKTFVIPKGKFLGDCTVKIDKGAFVSLPGSLNNTYALPLILLSATADAILPGKNYTVIVIKYIDEHSGYYYCKGSESEWDGTAVVGGTTKEYAYADLSKNKTRLLTTQSLTRFDMAGMGSLGNLDGTAVTADHLLVNLTSGTVTLTATSSGNVVTDRGSSYDAATKTFTLNYIYTKGGKSYLVNEMLVLRQDVEKELRFEIW